jgi:hypothetical protein
MQTQPIWLSFDMDIPCDGEGLYVWLDLHAAKACGRGFAFLHYSYENDLKRELAEDLRRSIELSPRASFYLVCVDPEDQKFKGSFIIGRRGSTPWHGYAQLPILDDIGS